MVSFSSSATVDAMLERIKQERNVKVHKSQDGIIETSANTAKD